MNARVIAELDLRRAQCANGAEKLRQQQRATPATSSRALALGKQVRDMQGMADEYAALLRVAKGMA